MRSNQANSLLLKQTPAIHESGFVKLVMDDQSPENPNEKVQKNLAAHLRGDTAKLTYEEEVHGFTVMTRYGKALEESLAKRKYRLSKQSVYSLIFKLINIIE